VTDSLSFIDDVFNALDNKRYLPPDARPKLEPVKDEPVAYDPNQRLEGFTPNLSSAPPSAPQWYPAAPSNGSKKRSFGERHEGEAPSDAFPDDDTRRHSKQQRRGPAFGGMATAPFGLGNQGVGGLPSPSSLYAHAALFPFDPANPQGFRFPPNLFPGAAGNGLNPSTRKKKRCWEFDAHGYCSRGLTCKFDHSVDFSALPPLPSASLDTDEGNPSLLPLSVLKSHIDKPLLGYDPNEPTFILHPPTFPTQPYTPPVRGMTRARRGDSRRGGRRRAKAPFSADGPVQDSSRKAIVVENIPEESFTEELVREFFSQFGTVEEVSMRPYRHLAVVKFDSHKSAVAAYRSPKVIFDNRFVKVFWYKEELDGSTTGRARASNGASAHDGPPGESDAPQIDMEDFIQKQTEAQRIYLEKKEKREALMKQKEELDKRQQELLVRQLEAKQKLEAKLGSEKSNDAVPNSTTESLRAQLKRLEEEAKILGLDPNANPAHAYADGESGGHKATWTRGGYRGGGRGGYRGRGRGGLRGGYGSGFGDVHDAYAAYSLDNRPKRVAVAGVDFTVPAKDEVLRQYLLVSFMPFFPLLMSTCCTI
jgi:RNA-binding protein 26